MVDVVTGRYKKRGVFGRVSWLVLLSLQQLVGGPAADAPTIQHRKVYAGVPNRRDEIAHTHAPTPRAHYLLRVSSSIGHVLCA